MRRTIEEVSKMYALTVKEASSYFGIGENSLRRLIRENETANFILRIGTHVRIKREKFQSYLDAQSTI